MMRDIFIPHLEEIPQWKDAYYDYQTLEQLYQLMRYSTVFLTYLIAYDKKLKKINPYSPDIQRIQKSIDKTQKIAFQCDQKFYLYSHRQTCIIYMFSQYKSFQIRRKFLKYQILAEALPQGDTDLLIIIQNSYIESYYLKKMLSFNITKQQSMIIRFRQLTRKFKEMSIFIQPNRRLHMIKYVINKLSNNLEAVYLRKTNEILDSAEVSLKYNNDALLHDNRFIIVLGIFVGILITALAFIVAFKELQGINVIQDTQFENIFPIWRGASYLVFYVWVLGIVVLLYQTAKIDYKLILQMDFNYHPRSSHILISAGFFTCIYLIFFFIYELQRSNILPTSIDYHWAGASWLIFLAYLFLPLPILQWRGRFYFLKLLAKAITSPFVTITFLHIWVTEQLVSFNQPFADFSYTVCKYVDFSNDCKISSLTSMIILTTFYTLRIIQNLKFAYQTNPPIWSGPYMGAIRAFLSLNTVIAAYVYKNDTNVIAYWLVFAILSTGWAWFVDVKFDWGFFTWNDQFKFVRKKIMVPNLRSLYFFMIFFNLILRCAWALTISPEIVRSLNLNKDIFIMILSFMQLLRRGIWNYFRVQFEHIKKCQKFEANVDDSYFQKKVQNKFRLKMSKQIEIDQYDNLRQTRQKEQMKILTQEISQCKKQKKELLEFVNDSNQKFMKIRKKLPQGYLKFEQQ